MLRLTKNEWSYRQALHQQRVDALLSGHWKRRSHGIEHPVFDFLFEYYSFRSTLLRVWSPGAGVLLENTQGQFLSELDWENVDQGQSLSLSLRKLSPKRRESLEWVRRLVSNTQERTPRFGCHGLHEWAMVYRCTDFRYQNHTKLRLDLEEIARLVDSFPVCCTHFDAFRFFTPQAQPLNVHQPSRENRMELEQRGCLHVNMDLYKWAYKFWPWVDSELVVDTFELALDARQLDMRASPYDLREYGFEPVRIETEEGRREYEREQRRIAEQAIPLRRRLMQSLDSLSGLCLNSTADTASGIQALILV